MSERHQRQESGDIPEDPFYGGTQRPPRAGRNQHDRQGSQSTYYGRSGDPGYNSMDIQSPSIAGKSAGYNSESFARHPDAVEPLKGGPDEELGQGAGWDVYADFNNAGPRYSSAFGVNLKADNGLPTAQPIYSYRPLSRPETVASKKAGSTAYEPEVELVTVPAMGSEWSAQELKDMKKSGQREIAAEKRARAWREFNRDQRGLCGIPWLTRKFIVIATFIFLIVLGVLLYFLIPRAPGFGFSFSTPLKANGGPAPYFNRLPANFSFTAEVDLQADTHASYIPIHFRNISAQIYASETYKLVATGSTGPLTMPANSWVPLSINMTFAYNAINSSDTTWQMYYQACQNKIAAVNATRPGLNIHLVLDMNIVGLIGSYGASTLINNIECPFQLPVNAG
ncbi:hypothetical protein FRB99_001737 [Tulasnella sp. 403]|nr:hypothetical protein FRB99_001737 [Tulasnella sp. 403]